MSKFFIFILFVFGFCLFVIYVFVIYIYYSGLPFISTSDMNNVISICASIIN